MLNIPKYLEIIYLKAKKFVKSLFNKKTFKRFRQVTKENIENITPNIEKYPKPKRDRKKIKVNNVEMDIDSANDYYPMAHYPNILINPNGKFKEKNIIEMFNNGYIENWIDTIQRATGLNVLNLEDMVEFLTKHVEPPFIIPNGDTNEEDYLNDLYGFVDLCLGQWTRN